MVRDTMRTHALKDAPNEPGAQKHRFKTKKIDSSKGSATGYIAKYVSKNIDGHALESATENTGPGPHTTNDTRADRAAERILTWATTWGIRQFQFFGTPPVTIWRELRRLDESSTDETIEAARAAADTGNYAAHLSAIGGAAKPRAAALLAIWRDPTPDLNAYFEPKPPKLRGILAVRTNHGEETRLTIWLISISGESPTPWTRVNNCSDFEIIADAYGRANWGTGPPEFDDPDQLRALTEALNRQAASSETAAQEV